MLIGLGKAVKAVSEVERGSDWDTLHFPAFGYTIAPTVSWSICNNQGIKTTRLQAFGITGIG